MDYGAGLHLADCRVGAVNPDSAAVEKMLHPSLERLNQVPGTGNCKADHVDDNVGVESGNVGAEFSGCLLEVRS